MPGVALPGDDRLVLGIGFLLVTARDPPGRT
jgi:hypothetical protein